MSKELEKHVWNLNKCSGCGGCVAVCSRGVLKFEQDKHPTHRKITRKVGLSTHELDACWGCDKFCEAACAHMKTLPETKIKSILSARANPNTPRSKFGDLQSDVVNQLLVGALESDYIDGAILTDVDRWTWKTFSRVVTTPEEIYETSSRQVMWSPTLVSLNEAIYTRKLKKIAVVGTPCVVATARCIMKSDIPGMEAYRKAIKTLIGRFCIGVAKQEFIEEVVKGEMGIDPTNILFLDKSVIDNFATVTLQDGSVKVIPLTVAQKYLRDGCARCDDYLGEQADISIGYTGSRRGYVTMITWNEIGEGIMKGAVQNGNIEINQSADIDRIYAAKEHKKRRERAEKIDDEYLIMLEGLTDPVKREEALKRYSQLKKGGK